MGQYHFELALRPDKAWFVSIEALGMNGLYGLRNSEPYTTTQMHLKSISRQFIYSIKKHK